MLVFPFYENITLNPKKAIYAMPLLHSFHLQSQKKKKKTQLYLKSSTHNNFKKIRHEM